MRGKFNKLIPSGYLKPQRSKNEQKSINLFEPSKRMEGNQQICLEYLNPQNE